ncbi:UDP-4-amino-4,6-dideoxy-N-acetyl-beta-L-altrosamine transaminase [Flaviaesturariibacter flavus]|uniref:UDP-4-amino-4, 6-dideoxy-N-acetyl-beta-L-altrosamine transaminase n=1 Tax=Flaviaesturariibacter flavus TaxID=2502780 RepID=A0A4R1BB37_9BACT|nr:UDP-4-amino-4,6-dideoxy-N-acetyl-beta-L-altrosamine transaminase [Flaviaesturariibacter flavus]TCJ14173.1 UDP-4-amino-4,6-dideoxy-N-acetyl-beta-L-altrosamine transaminase [Flaviaesturariibacter flavus]
MKPIPYGKQYISVEDLQAVTDTLQSDFLTQGPRIGAFEKEFADYIGAKYAIALSNGTAALHLAAAALDVKEGTNVITTPITFAASANCVRYCGGNVYFADIDPRTYLIDLNKVEDLLKSKPQGFFSGIVPVDFAGAAVNLEELKTLTDKYGLWILEDACHAPGGYFTDSKGVQQWCGNGAYADAAIYSFHPVKHIACGEGGAITTNNEAIFKKLLKSRTHGITRDTSLFENSIEFATGGVAAEQYPGWYMEMQELGYNYRLTDFQAALGSSQLRRADEGLVRRRAIAAAYAEAFAGKPWLRSQSGVVEGHAYHLYVIEVEKRYELYNYLRSKNIFAQVHYIPTHLMPYYKSLGWKEGDLPNAERYYQGCLSLPMFPTLTDEELAYVIETINAFYAQ